MRRRKFAVVVTLMAGVAFGQEAAAPPSFEVASVKPAPPPTGRGIRMGMGGDPGRINYNNVTLKILIARAYNVKDYQVSGPDWLSTERYEVTATMPPNTPKETVALMLQKLLAERFQLKLHRETKELPVYALVAAKNGPKLKAAEAGGRAMMRMMPGKLEASAIDLASFATTLSNLVGRPVLDMTGLKGSYDCTLEFTADPSLTMGMMKMAGPGPDGGALPPPESSGPSLFTAIQEQLGLKLESRKAPLDIIVVDGAEKVPTEN